MTLFRCETCEQVVELPTDTVPVICRGRPLEDPREAENHGPMEPVE